MSSNLEKGYVLSSFEDMEEVIGNIVENSCKWAVKRVLLEIKESNDNKFIWYFLMTVRDYLKIR